MSYSLRTPKNTLDKQKATTYILYMIAGSYFHKCECKTLGTAKHLFLYYKDFPMKKQLKMEEEIIKAVEKQLTEKGIKISDLNAEVTIKKKDKSFVILLQTWFENMIILVDDRGKYRIKFYTS